jgi:hypothetical protein
MRLFISWSGDLSRRIAERLFEWLPMVLQGVEPYMSSESIEKGARWSSHIGKELEEASFGLVILTKENLSSRWLHFEAGAIAKSVEESRVAPLLFGIRPADVLQPLSQFQVTNFARDDVLKLLKSANLADEGMLMPESRLTVLFEKLWPDLQEKIDAILREDGATKNVAARSTEEILEEVLALGREQAMALAHPDRLLGSSVDILINKVLSSYFESESSLSGRERNLVLALMGRWNALANRLLVHFERDDLALEADGVRRQLLQFRRYLDEANQVIVSANAVPPSRSSSQN